MLSTTLELAGLGCFVVAAYLGFTPLGRALIIGGACLLFVGYAAEGVAPIRAVVKRLRR